MPDYSFLNLSPPEFEDLTKDLLQKQFDITLETFTSGRDNGIDLRYSLSPKDNLIIQCKRYKDYNSLIGNLRKEVSKVEELNPTRYIISTTVGLTPNQKDVILALFSPYILNTSDIFGQNDLNNLLSLFPDIEKQHFKLWLSSTNILDKILHSKIYNQSNFEEKIIKETINVYVDNESYYNANKIIKEKKYVIISGIPGIGKTTLARILVYHYLANGFEEFVFLSDSINEAFTIYKDGVKQIFLFDDFLGTNFLENKLSNNEEQRIVKFIERVAKSKDKIIIFTTREYILAQAKQKYDAFDSPSLEFAKCIIDHTCPQQQILTSNGSWYQKNKERYFYLSKHYKTHACTHCTARSLCTKNKKGRVIERSEYAPYMEINKCNIEANPETYKKRQSIVEHPYGTIKRQWGFYYIITKRGLKRASADVGFMFVAYNLRRLMNIIDKNMLTKFLQELVALFFPKTGFLKAIRTVLCLQTNSVINRSGYYIHS